MQLLAFDPGETIGWCWFENDQPINWGQFSWLDLYKLKLLFDAPCPNQIVAERFFLYRSHAAAQVNSEFPTVQVIGMLKLLAWERNVPLTTQPASMIHSKGWLIPPVRKYVDHYLTRKPEHRHARDAMAHGFVWWRDHAPATSKSA